MATIVTAVDYLHARRPWLSLYGVRLRPKVDVAAEGELAEIQKRVPDELMLVVLSKVGPYSLGKVACVCRHWHILSEHSRLWETVCQETLQHCVKDKREMDHMMATQYRCSWKRMFVHHPHLRFDGVYVSRNTYVRPGVVEFTSHKAVHLVSYFRYYRFFPDGTLLYRTSPNTVSRVAKGMRSMPREVLKDPAAFSGRYILKGTRVYCMVVYPNSRSTEIRSRLGLRSTRPGANDRLDMELIASFDRENNITTDMAPEETDLEAASGEGLSREHKRGMAPCVFIPWESVHTSVLNLPAQQMDFFVAG